MSVPSCSLAQAGTAGYPAYYPAQPVAAATSSVKGGVALGLGIASLVFWLLPILGFPMSIAGIVVGSLALSTGGRKLGQWGLVLSCIGLVLSLLTGSGLLLSILAAFFRAS